MTLPGPAAFARRCITSLARRPANALESYLHESYPDAPTLSEEWLTVAAGAGSFVIVALGTALALALSVGYALVYAVIGAIRRGVARTIAGARARLTR